MTRLDRWLRHSAQVSERARHLDQLLVSTGVTPRIGVITQAADELDEAHKIIAHLQRVASGNDERDALVRVLRTHGFIKDDQT